jgi:hypothetical protein
MRGASVFAFFEISMRFTRNDSYRRKKFFIKFSNHIFDSTNHYYKTLDTTETIEPRLAKTFQKIRINEASKNKYNISSEWDKNLKKHKPFYFLQKMSENVLPFTICIQNLQKGLV